MGFEERAEKLANAFGRAVVRRKWPDVHALFTTALQAQRTAEDVAAELSWDQLGPRIRQMDSDLTGVPLEEVPLYDPPKQFEVYEVEEREAPEGVTLTEPWCWMEVDFQPSDSSEFDYCYNCFLAVTDEGGPKIAAYAIETATE